MPQIFYILANENAYYKLEEILSTYFHKLSHCITFIECMLFR